MTRPTTLTQRIQVPAMFERPPLALVPMRSEWVPLAWEWLHEFPLQNFDDYGPSTLEEFSADLLARHNSGHILIGVMHDSQCIGVIGFVPVTKRLGHFSGICFSKQMHGTGLPFHALRVMLDALWSQGYEKIEAMFFADNQQAAGLFRKLGSFHEGKLIAHTMRGGKPVDCSLVGFLRPEGF